MSQGESHGTAHLFSKLVVCVEQEEQLDFAFPSKVSQLVNLSVTQCILASKRFVEEIGHRILQSWQICFDEDVSRPAGVVAAAMHGFDVQLELGREG